MGLFVPKLRIYKDNKMEYINNYSVDVRKNTITGYIGKQKIVSEFCMQTTSASAINGDIYEYDIIKKIKDSDDANNFLLVIYDEDKNSYFGVNNNSVVNISKDMFEYEVIGNIFEDLDYFYMINIRDKNIFNQIQTVFAIISDEPKEMDISIPKEEDIAFAPIERKDSSKDIKEPNCSSGEISAAADYDENNLNLLESNMIFVYLEAYYDTFSKSGSYGYVVSIDGKSFCKLNKVEGISQDYLWVMSLYELLVDNNFLQKNIKIISTIEYLTTPFIQGWINIWKSQNWINPKTNISIKNYELWEQIYQISLEKNLFFEYCEDVLKSETLECLELVEGMYLE